MSRRKQAAPRPIKQVHSELFENFYSEEGENSDFKIKEEPFSESDECPDEEEEEDDYDEDYDDEEDGNWVIAEDEGSDEEFDGDGKDDESMDTANEEDDQKITIETGDNVDEEAGDNKDKDDDDASGEGGSSQYGWSYTYKDGRPMCRYCGRSFMSIGGLKIHSHRCREEKAKRVKEQKASNPEVQCWKCKAIFSTRSSMKRHEKKCGKLYFRSRPMRDMGTTRCNYCKKEFLTRSLMKHLSRCKWLTNSQLQMQYRRVILPKGSDPGRAEIAPANPSPTSTTAPSAATSVAPAPIKIAPAQPATSPAAASNVQSPPAQQPIAAAIPQLPPAVVMTAAPGSQPPQLQYIMPVMSTGMSSPGNSTAPIFMVANVGANVPPGSVIAGNVVPASSSVTNILPSGIPASGVTTLVPVSMVSTTMANVSPNVAVTRALTSGAVVMPTTPATNIAATSVTNVLPANGTATPTPAASASTVAVQAANVTGAAANTKSPTGPASAAVPVTTAATVMTSAPTQQLVIPAFQQPGQVIQQWQPNQTANQPSNLVISQEIGSHGNAVKQPIDRAQAIPASSSQNSSEKLPRRSPRRHAKKSSETETSNKHEEKSAPLILPQPTMPGKVAIPRLSRPIGGRILVPVHRIKAIRAQQISTPLQHIKPKPSEATTTSSPEKRVVLDVKSMMNVREVNLAFHDKQQGVFVQPAAAVKDSTAERTKRKKERGSVRNLDAQETAKKQRVDESNKSPSQVEGGNDEPTEKTDDITSDHEEESENTVLIDGKAFQIKQEPSSPPPVDDNGSPATEDADKNTNDGDLYIGVSIKTENPEDSEDNSDPTESQASVSGSVSEGQGQEKDAASNEGETRKTNQSQRRYRMIAPKPTDPLTVAVESHGGSEDEVGDDDNDSESDGGEEGDGRVGGGGGGRKVTIDDKNPIRHADGQLECEECGRLFKSLRNYNRHYPSHIDDKRFKCNICSKTFHLSYHLKEHMNKHYDLRPYKCHLCGKAYNHSGTLSGHLKMAHKNESIPLRDIMKCKFCCKVFAYEGTYYKHLEDRHNVTMQRFYTPPTPGSWQTVTSIPVGLPEGSNKDVPQASDTPTTELPVQNYEYVPKDETPHVNPLPQRVSRKRRAMRLAGKLNEGERGKSEGRGAGKVGVSNTFTQMQQPYYQNDPKFRAILPRPTGQPVKASIVSVPAIPANTVTTTNPGLQTAIPLAITTIQPPPVCISMAASTATPTSSTETVSSVAGVVMASSTPAVASSSNPAEISPQTSDSVTAVSLEDRPVTATTTTTADLQDLTITEPAPAEENQKTASEVADDVTEQRIRFPRKRAEDTSPSRPIKPFPCHYCPQAFTTKLRLSFHVTKEHSSRPMNSISHQRKVSSLRIFGATSKLVVAKYRCVLCLYFFRDLPTLRRHITNYHRCVNPEMFIADVVKEQEDNMSHRKTQDHENQSFMEVPPAQECADQENAKNDTDSELDRSGDETQESSNSPIDQSPSLHSDENSITEATLGDLLLWNESPEDSDLKHHSRSHGDQPTEKSPEPSTSKVKRRLKASSTDESPSTSDAELMTSQQKPGVHSKANKRRGKAPSPDVHQAAGPVNQEGGISLQPVLVESKQSAESAHDTALCLFPLHCATDNLLYSRTVTQHCPKCNWSFLCKVKKDLQVITVNSLTVKHMCPSCLYRFEYGFTDVDSESDFLCMKCRPKSRNRPKCYVVVNGALCEESKEKEDGQDGEDGDDDEERNETESRTSPVGVVGVQSFPCECKKCSTKFFVEVDTNKILCTTCNEFVEREKFNEHTKMHVLRPPSLPSSPPPQPPPAKAAGPNQCRICYRQVDDMESHMKMSHRTIHDVKEERKYQRNTGMYKCKACGQSYLFRGSLERHMEMCHKEMTETEKCQVEKCGKVFQSAERLAMHMKNSHAL